MIPSVPRGTRTPSPYELLARYPDHSRPWVTHYAGPGSRVELSVATGATAVAKAAWLLRDGLGLAPGGEVSVDLPRHWQLPVWTLAALSVGARCGRALPGSVDARVVGPQGPALPADAVVACSCDSFGMPVPGGLPTGFVDAAEVRAYPDVYAAEPGAADAASLVVAGEPVPWPDLLTALSEPTPGTVPPSRGPLPGADGRVPPGARLWVDETTDEHRLQLAVSVAPVLALGSVVIATGLTGEDTARIRAIEAVTADVPAGPPRP